VCVCRIYVYAIASLRRYHACTMYQMIQRNFAVILKQEAFEKCWAHSPLRAATRPFTRCRYCRKPHCRTPPAHRCARQRRRRQRQRVTEGTAMAPQNGPNEKAKSANWLFACCQSHQQSDHVGLLPSSSQRCNFIIPPREGCEVV